MSDKEKAAILEAITRLSPEDKSFVLGWAARAAQSATVPQKSA